MNVLEVLTEARKLIDSPEKWTRGVAEKDGRFCSYGAITQVCKITNHYVKFAALRHLALAINSHSSDSFSTVVCFNDHHYHSEVLEKFDLAIAQERERLMALPGKSKTITVEPIRQPAQVPIPEPKKEPVKA